MDDPAELERLIFEGAPDKDFLLALGAMVHHFAHVERTITVVLAQVAGLSFYVARALLSGIRADQGKSLIIRVLEAQGMHDDISLLRPAFDKLGDLIAIRNDLLHSGISRDVELDYAIWKIGYTRSREIKYKIHTDDLRNISVDLVTIYNVLLYFNIKTAVPEAPHLPQLKAQAHRPWLYKSRRPTGPASTPQSRPRKPKPPQPP